MKIQAKTLALAVGLTIGLAGTASAVDLKLMTGPQGGSWVPLGGQLKDMWEKAIPGLAVQSLPGAGIANVRGIEEGKADVGFGNSISTVDALAGKRAVQQAARQRLQHRDALSAIFPGRGAAPIPASTRSKDLKGKALTTQPRGNTGELITKQHPAGQRPDLQRREDELRVLHRLGRRRCRTATPWPSRSAPRSRPAR